MSYQLSDTGVGQRFPRCRRATDRCPLDHPLSDNLTTRDEAEHDHPRGKMAMDDMGNANGHINLIEKQLDFTVEEHRSRVSRVRVSLHREENRW